MLLSDVVIVDATDRLGWLAGRVLADLGADVIKLEPPGSDRDRADWRAFNVNKRVLELDPANAADQVADRATAARRRHLPAHAGIIALSAARLDPDELRTHYPRLVVVAIGRSAASVRAADGRRATSS